MSQANVDVVRGIYDAFGRGDVDAVWLAHLRSALMSDYQSNRA